MFMLVTFLLSSLLFLHAPRVESKVLPRGLVVFLDKIGIPLDNLLKNRGSRPHVSAISARRYDATTRSQASSDTPEHSSGVKTTYLNNPRYMPKDAFCGLRQVAVRIPKGPGVRSLPDYIMLQRCTGSCLTTQDTQHCAVTAQDAINVRIYEVIGKVFYPVDTVIYDHTACGCDCIKKPSGCDPKKQVWDAHTCGCKCKTDGSECNSMQRFNKCECECKDAAQHCPNPGKEWDYKNCGCHCKKDLQEKCAAQNKPIDTKTCKCTGPGVNAIRGLA